MKASRGMGDLRECKKPDKMKTGGWIKDAIKKPGALRKTLGAKAGEPILEKKLEKAAKGNSVTAKRARLALTLKGLKK